MSNARSPEEHKNENLLGPAPSPRTPVLNLRAIDPAYSILACMYSFRSQPNQPQDWYPGKARRRIVAHPQGVCGNGASWRSAIIGFSATVEATRTSLKKQVGPFVAYCQLCAPCSVRTRTIRPCSSSLRACFGLGPHRATGALLSHERHSEAATQAMRVREDLYRGT